MTSLTTNRGEEAILRSASLRWQQDGNGFNYQGDVSIEVDPNRPVSSNNPFTIRLHGQKVLWVLQPDGNEAKQMHPNIVSLALPLPTDCKEAWHVHTPRKFRGRKTRVVSLKVVFPQNSQGLHELQITVEVFNKDTTAAYRFHTALMYCKLETFADTMGATDPSGWYRKHRHMCTCKLCIRQALRSTNDQHSS